MARRKRTAIAIGLIAIALLVLIPAAYFWISNPGIPHVELPVPNGFPIFVEAGRSVVDPNTRVDIAAANVDTLRKYLADNRQALARTHEALRMECMVPVEYTVEYQQQVSRVAPLRNPGRLLWAEARVAHLEGNLEDAAAAYVAMIEFCQKASKNGLLMHLQIALAYERVAWRGLAELAPQLDKDQKANTRDRLDSIDYLQPNLDEYWAREHALATAVQGKWATFIVTRSGIADAQKKLLDQLVEEIQALREQAVKALQ